MQLDDLTGLWRRSLIVRADGARDTTTRVHWLQATTLYADLRQPSTLADFRGVGTLDDLSLAHCIALAGQEGFAGRLCVDGAHFLWERWIDYQPASTVVDAGSLEWQAEILVERGRDADYLEHWHRDAGHSAAVTGSAVLQHRNSPAIGILVRVGPHFMYVRDRTIPLTFGHTLRECVSAASDVEAARAMIDCEISIGQITNQVWRITASTLHHRIGRGVAEQSRFAWEIVEIEGNISDFPT